MLPVPDISFRACVNDCYTFLPYEIYTDFNCYRNQEVYIERNENLRRFIMSATVLRKLALEFGIVTLLSWDGGKWPTPAFFGYDAASPKPKLLQPLTTLNADFVASESGIVHTPRSHPPTCGAEERCHAAVITKAYKNDMVTIIDYINHLVLQLIANYIDKDNNQSPDKDICEGLGIDGDCPSSSAKWRNIIIYGSGGSPQASDQYARS
jgi:hypothetical protein